MAIFVYTLLLMILCLGFFYIASLHSQTAIIVCLIWGIAITIFGMLMQSKVIEVAPDATDIATAIYSGIYNIGIGGGALVGGQVIQHLNMQKIGYFGAGFILVALILFVWMSRKIWIQEQKNAQ